METIVLKIKRVNFDRGICRDILNLAWPSITEQMLVMMVGMMSTIFVGRIGTQSMAAVGMVNMLVAFLQTAFAGLATGTTVIVARVIGEGNRNKAKSTLIQSMFMGIICGLTISAFGYIFAQQILRLFFGAAEVQVLSIAIQYYRIILIGLPFLVLDLIIAGSVRGAGDTKTPMIITGIVNIVNIVLSILLIWGFSFGNIEIQALGVTGAAMAVTSARISGVFMRIIALYFLKNPKLGLSLKDCYAFDVKLIKRIIKVGFPAFIEQMVTHGGFLILQVIIVSMGTAAVATYQVGVNVNSLAFMPIFGFSIAVTTLVGKTLGEKEYKKAEKYNYETIKIGMFAITLVGALMFIFARPLAGLYTKDAEVIKKSIGLIRVFAVVEPMMAITFICSATLKAAGDMTYVMSTSIVGLWSCRIGIVFVVNYIFNIGIYAVMIGICFDYGIRAVMYILRINKGNWKYLRV
jgi:putative MATE family efflux protein